MQEISKQFDFNKREDEIYALWEKSGFFSPDKIEATETYCNILPPPNANGELHLGHASGYAVMDIFGRYERMLGKKVLLLPGKDHAGIQTQVVFERKLKAEKNVTRYDFGRENFYKECYDFCIDRSNYMRSQEKKIGISADWAREKFTLDPDVLKIAMETFVKMYQDGLVYKGERIINWCPRCATALADVEVEHKETEGKLYYIKYPIKDSQEFITVATTRPETMLGDTAVAVNPKDERFTSLVGKSVILPLMNTEIPIIADRRIEMEFGTGAVKITPAHDQLDWQIGKDHKLPEIQVINEKAEISVAGGEYAGMNVLEARAKIILDLEKLGLLEKEEVLINNVSVCERCKTVIEPLISKQWFVAVDAEKYSLKGEALKAIDQGEIKIYPENFKKILIHWFENLNDWCISRQIWWGPRFPVWYRGEEIFVGMEAPAGEGWVQDEDTFDTWFTSGQWVHTTLKSKADDFANFFPTDTMVMGRDLLFFWSTRMIMTSLYVTGKVPFKNLFFTGLIRDKEGQKLSKSKGNGIDPLPMIEKFGADALRLSLVMDIAPGQDTRLFEEKIENFRNFVTKLWNMFRYCVNADEKFVLLEKLESADVKSLADKWILAELRETELAVTNFMAQKEISLAQSHLRKFTWDCFADWYIEINKLEKNTAVLGYVFDKILKMWHPFVPFVTEEIFQILHGEDGKLLMMSAWPTATTEISFAEEKIMFTDVMNLIVKIRNLRAVYQISNAEIIEAYAVGEVAGQEIMERLAKVKISVKSDKGKFIKLASGELSLDLDVAKVIDIPKELERIAKGMQEMTGLIAKNEAMLKNEKFRQGAPKEILEAAENRIEKYKEELAGQIEMKKQLESL